jgi:hypothetical protein
MPRTLLAVIGLAGALLPLTAVAEKFYTDDPLLREPTPVRVEKIKSRKVNDYFDFFSNSLVTVGERSTPVNRIPAGGVNTLGEVMDGAWYVNRHYRKRMSIEELRRGPDGPTNAPSETGSWRIVGAKTQGVTPGFTIVDSRGVRYLLKFDPPSNPEMATATDVIGTHFFYALGYHVPENYIVNFPAERLVLDPKTTFIDGFGKKRRMTNKDVFEVMRVIPRNKDGNFRGTMSLYLKGTPVGERRFHGTRSDDPNDVVPHEHRRDLRGLYVLCAWLGHDDSRSINSLDMLVDDGPNRYVRHYLIDFGSILGSASTKANSARSGADYLFSWRTAAKQFLTLGLWVPEWAKADFPDLPAVGKFEYEVFDPDKYRPEYPNPAFQNRDAVDEFWGAKQVMHFTDEEIAAIVQLGQYSDPRSAEWITKCLIERRNKIGKTFLSRVLPLDRFSVQDGQLQFEDLGVLHKLVPARTYGFVWSRFDNGTGQKAVIAGATGPRLPAEVSNAAGGEYFAADISGSGSPHGVTVYLRKSADGVRVIGLDRTQK